MANQLDMSQIILDDEKSIDTANPVAGKYCFEGITRLLNRQIMVETCDQILVGTLGRVSFDGGVLELKEAREIVINLKYKNKLLVPLATIQKVKKFKLDVNYDADELDENWDFPTINLTHFDLRHIEHQTNSICYISHPDQFYRDAIEDIKAQRAVGVVVEPYEFGRNNFPGFISIATVRTVYIFDVQSIGINLSKFRTIFDQEKPLKVMHYSNKISDLFKYRLDISINGLYDTVVACRILDSRKHDITLKKFIKRYFNIPTLFLSHNGQPFNTIRPLPIESRTWIAKMTAFQLKFYESIPIEKLPHNFTDLCKKFSSDLNDVGVPIFF